MKELNIIISNNLVNLRKKYCYKQSYVAEKLKYSDKTVSKWETGEIVPSVENLIELAKLYNVTLDQITSPMNFDDKEYEIKKKDYSKYNKHFIALLAISAIWIFATIAFVYANILSNKAVWIAFVWAVPASFIVAIVFNSLWGKKKINYIYISLLIWTLIAAFYLQFLQYNLVPLFFVGVPAQIAVILWSRIKR